MWCESTENLWCSLGFSSSFSLVLMWHPHGFFTMMRLPDTTTCPHQLHHLSLFLEVPLWSSMTTFETIFALYVNKYSHSHAFWGYHSIQFQKEEEILDENAWWKLIVYSIALIHLVACTKYRQLPLFYFNLRFPHHEGWRV